MWSPHKIYRQETPRAVCVCVRECVHVCVQECLFVHIYVLILTLRQIDKHTHSHIWFVPSDLNQRACYVRLHSHMHMKESSKTLQNTTPLLSCLAH